MTENTASALGYKYLFGPVFSRRLGRSLGVDLLPYKTCSLDCIYCECGATTDLTATTASFVPAADVLAELDDYLGRKPGLDFVTFAGSGEPTLHAELARIIAHLKAKHADYKVAVLTNGTLFTRPEVRAAVMQADLLVPSLDGATTSSFEVINRPAPGIEVADVIDGLILLRRQYRGTFVLEVFIVPGVNDTDDEVRALREAALRIAPDAIQLNRLDRPGILPWIAQASDELLAGIHAQLEPLTVFEVARRQAGETRRMDDEQVRSAILSRLAERAFDTTTLAFLVGCHEGLVAKHVNQLLAEGRLRQVASERQPPPGAPRRLVVEAILDGASA
jgi:wyosine [tRNA(Phe)-imidazoG37] synthetase (radical SAM superfamily)